MRIDAIVFDCRDAAPLARFWAATLDWNVAPYDEVELARLAAKGITDPEEDPTPVPRGSPIFKRHGTRPDPSPAGDLQGVGWQYVILDVGMRSRG